MSLLRKLCTPALCAAILLTACQKEVATSSEQKNAPNEIRFSGVVPDDPALEAKVPIIMSAQFQEQNALGAVRPKGGSKVTDTDKDGIPDANDSCPTQAETINGYQDGDGCPDTAPVSNNSDATAPIVSITTPTNGATVSETVNITVNASDNIGVSSVSYIVDGVIIGTSTTAPFGISWNTTTVATGTHSLTAKVYDAAGNSSVSTISVYTSSQVLPNVTLPASYQLVTPPVGSQGNEGSCVAWAIAYGARSIEQYYTTNASTYSNGVNIFSPEYVYNQTKFGDCGSGTAITTVLDLIKSQGVSTWQAMPYSDVNGCSLLPDANQTANASAFKIGSYVKMANSDQAAIKTMIASKHPVIVTVIADNSFVNAGAGFTWKTYSGSGALPHTIIICGYDDARNAYKVMNSWGTGWGDGGYSWIDYDFLPQKSSYYTYAIQ